MLLRQMTGGTAFHQASSGLLARILQLRLRSAWRLDSAPLHVELTPRPTSADECGGEVPRPYNRDALEDKLTPTLIIVRARPELQLPLPAIVLVDSLDPPPPAA